MSNEVPTIPAAPGAREDWSEAATKAFDEIVAAAGTIDAATLVSLYAAIDLLSDADDMAAKIALDGLIVKGSQEQPVAHPLISEVRLYRTQAQATLRALGLTSRSGASAAGAALAGKRWGNRSGAAGVASIEDRLRGAAQ